MASALEKYYAVQNIPWIHSGRAALIVKSAFGLPESCNVTYTFTMLSSRPEGPDGDSGTCEEDALVDMKLRDVTWRARRKRDNIMGWTDILYKFMAEVIVR